MIRNALTILVGCLVFSSVVVAAQQRLKLTNGREIVGEVTETKEGYEVKTKVGTIVLSKDDVAGVEKIVSPKDEFEERLGKIDKKDARQVYDLARWALNKGLLDEAKQLSRTLEKISPDSLRTQMLARLIKAEQQKKDNGEPTNGGDTGNGSGPAAREGALPKDWVVSQDDIYRIRLEEVDDNERVQVKFRDDVVDRFIKMMDGRGDFEDSRFATTFRGFPRWRQMQYILDHIDRDNSSIKNDILIQRDPQFMVDFRLRIWPLVKQHCAAADCHGARKARGNLKLFTSGATPDRLMYTNYALLHGYKDDKGRLMIDRDNPDRSLLLQFAMPRSQAMYKHPEQTKMRPMVRNEKSATYKRMYKWIDGLKKPPHPNYRLDYEPPLGMKIHDTSGFDLPPLDTQPADTQPDEGE
ncbi:MAG: hypothetical protein ACLFVU_01000 [Phycisphaerae bacterium]